VFALAVINWVADCGCLACAILATGARVPWHGLVLAYGAGAAVGSTGVTPGGFGIVEVTLTAALAAVGLSAAQALTAVLTYRLINFWLILIGGWITVIVLTHRHRPDDEFDVLESDGDGGSARDDATAVGDRANRHAGDGANRRASESAAVPGAGGQAGMPHHSNPGPDQLTQAGQINQNGLID
jgi:hypothetical protein